MADEDGHKPRHYRAVWGRAFADWKATGHRALWGIGVATASAAVSALRTGIMSPPVDWTSISVSALFGGIVGPAIAAFAVLLWHRFRAPARIWAADQQTIADLSATCEQLKTEAARQANESACEIEHLQRQVEKLREFNYQEALTARLELEMGEESHRTGEERLRRGEARLEVLENEIGSGDFSNAAEILALRKILPGIFATGVHGRARQRIIERVHDLAGAVEIHFRRSEDPPLSKASEPSPPP